MDKKKLIDEIFNILIQFEKISDDSSNVTEQTYKGYLDRLFVWYMGYNNQEIATGIKGLYNLGAEASHETVKRSVFHMIDVLKKEMRDGCHVL